MKHILVLLALCASTLHAADVVVVQSATSVSVNGVNAGKPADTIRNRPELASAIQVALEKRAAEQAKALADVQAELAATQAKLSTLLTKLNGINSAEVKALLAEENRPENDKKRAKLREELAAKQKELDNIR